MPKIVFEEAEYQVAPGESVLDALIRGGANVSFSCRKGTCQACIMQVADGDPGADSRKGLRQGVVEAGMFLPCCAHPAGDLRVERPDLSRLVVKLHLADKDWLSESICRFSFEPETQLVWRAGQFVNLRREDGVTRSYSITSIPEQDYFLTIHVKRIPDGELSNWLCDQLEPGGVIDGQGPLGTCYYDADYADRDMLLLATGSGLSPVHGLCRDALLNGHRGRIVLYHGSRRRDGLYLREELEELSARHPNFAYRASLTREEPLPPDVLRGRIVDHALREVPKLDGWLVFACGVPEMVHEARCRAVLAGAARDDIRTDPFEYSHQYQPDDSAKIAGIQADPGLWEALGRGKVLMAILSEFYDLAYEDARLAPFFHKVTKQRAKEQQYAFLADLFSGQRNFFGLRPFNAHHWMIISDELFDYREALIEQVMRRHGLEEHFIRRWSALHELFRREIVKSSARGMIVDGTEKPLEQPEEVTLDVGTLCDGCEAAMGVGDVGRFHPQTGKLFCAGCAATAPRSAAGG